jgi:hypothetical protein
MEMTYFNMFEYLLNHENKLNPISKSIFEQVKMITEDLFVKMKKEENESSTIQIDEYMVEFINGGYDFLCDKDKKKMSNMCAEVEDLYLTTLREVHDQQWED